MLISKRGSASVEAAVVIPVLILIIAGIISVSIQLNEKVRSSCGTLIAQSAEYMENRTLTTEDILRGKWLLK